MNTKTSSGISFPTLLFIVFLILKLTNVIDWSWWWVTSPLWISAGLTLLIMGIIVILSLCSYKVRSWVTKNF